MKHCTTIIVVGVLIASGGCSRSTATEPPSSAPVAPAVPQDDGSASTDMARDPEVARALHEMRYAVGGRGEITPAEETLLAVRTVSAPMCREILDANWNEDAHLLSRLFFILGILKDPAAIDALRGYWDQHEFRGLSPWLSGWNYQLGYFCAHESEWSAIAPTWSAFSRWLLEQELPSEQRIPLTDCRRRVVLGCRDDRCVETNRRKGVSCATKRLSL